MGTEGICAGADAAGGLGGAVVVMNANGGEVNAKARLKEGTVRRG
jgi:hypothetical protein